MQAWCVVSLGKIESRRPAFHDAHNIWPIGYVSVLKKKKYKFIFEILDSEEIMRKSERKFPSDSPVFKIAFQLTGKGTAIDEFFSETVPGLWTQVSSKYSTLLSENDRFFGLDTSQQRIERLEGASDCEDYEFIAHRTFHTRINQRPESCSLVQAASENLQKNSRCVLPDLRALAPQCLVKQ